MEDTKILKLHNFNCMHNRFLVDHRSNTVECGICGEKLNPVWVLTQLCGKETRAENRLNHLNKLSEKAIKKNRCKCEYCNKMTRIQR